MDNYDYKGWKILNKLHIFAKKYPNKYREYEYPQAMISSSEKPEALETAKKWASGKYSNWTENDYIQYDIDNEDIEFELLDSANGSSQGGKLSFWNCIISKGDMKVIVGISSDLLVELLKNTDFEKGKCKSKVILARYKNQWGAIAKNMKEYKEAIKDMEIYNDFNNAKKTSKWKPGYEYYSKTQKSIYLYDLYQWYEVNDNYYSSYATIKEYKKPITKKKTLDDWYYEKYTKLSEFIEKESKMTNDWKFVRLFTPGYDKEKLPSRIEGNKVLDIDVDIATINKYLLEYRERITNEFLSQTKDHRSCYLNELIGAYAYSTNKDDKPIIPPEVFDKIYELYGQYNIKKWEISNE